MDSWSWDLNQPPFNGQLARPIKSKKKKKKLHQETHWLNQFWSHRLIVWWVSPHRLIGSVWPVTLATGSWWSCTRYTWEDRITVWGGYETAGLQDSWLWWWNWQTAPTSCCRRTSTSSLERHKASVRVCSATANTFIHTHAQRTQVLTVLWLDADLEELVLKQNTVVLAHKPLDKVKDTLCLITNNTPLFL